MDIQQIDFQTKKTVRYFTSGDKKQSNALIVALHGYGQLPSYFLRKFEGIHSNYFVVAPEGLHRFYLNGTSGRVGSSWMTKEARLNDIEDTMNYLKALIDQLKTENSFEKIILLGFSQGGAAAARYFHKFPNDIDQLIMWASIFPPDLEIGNELSNPSQTKRKMFAIGSEDEFFFGENQQKIIDYYASHSFETFQFEGKHTIEITTLNKMLSSIRNN